MSEGYFEEAANFKQRTIYLAMGYRFQVALDCIPFCTITSRIRKTGQSAPGPFKKSNHSSLLISATVDAFRGHGFSLLSQQDVGHEGVATRCGDLSLCSFALSSGVFSSFYSRRSRHLRCNQLKFRWQQRLLVGSSSNLT